MSNYTNHSIMKITNKCKLEPIVFNPTCLNNILYWAYFNDKQQYKKLKY